MQTETTSGLVIRGVDFSDTSRILTLFTRDFGKLGVLAKGGRRLKSRFEVSLDVLSVCGISVIRKPSAELDLLTEAVLLERFTGFRKDLAALYAGYYVAELLDGLTHHHEPHPLLFDISVLTLRLLAEGKDRQWTLCAWLSGLLADLGYAAHLDDCVGCRKALAPDIRLQVSQRAGGILCERCRGEFADSFTVQKETLGSLRTLAAANLEADANVVVAPVVRREAWRFLSGNVEALLNRRPKTLAWLTF